MNLERMPSTVVSYPAWLRGWCALTVVTSGVAVIFGTLVTTFHVGMADPLWPTAPWHLLVNERLPSFGWYVEHTHRAVAFVFGMVVFVQSLGLWQTCPERRRRLGAHAALVALAVGLNLWMILVFRGPRAVSSLINWGLLPLAGGAIWLVIATAADLRSRTAGRWSRALVTVAAIGVIAQAMIGGLRVYLNATAWQDLRVVHGVVAQVVFASVCLVALMTTRRWNALTDLVTESPLRRLTAATLVVLLVQIAFGGLLRHLDNPLARRLHPLLAFAALALIVWTAARTFMDVDGAAQLRRKAVGMLALIGLQAALGIEALLRATDVARNPDITVPDAALRSLHVLVGFGVFASAALLAARAWKARLI